MSDSHIDGEQSFDQGASGDSYADRVRTGASEDPDADTRSEPNGDDNDDGGRPRPSRQYRTLTDFEREHFHPHNVTPDRPCTAFFRAGSLITSKHILDSLRGDGIPPNAVRCLQRKPTGEVLITFTTAEYCRQFLDNSAFFVRSYGYRRGYPAHPAAGELTFVTIYDAPFEMPDSAIEERLKPYCTVYTRRMGKLQGHSDINNGLRHFRVELKSTIPCYLRFGKFQLRFYHDGQQKTCRRCGAADHIARDCANEVCFNCDEIGHQSKSCPQKMRCCICKSEEHLAIDCPLSWYRRPASHRDAAPDEPAVGPTQSSEADASHADVTEGAADDGATQPSTDPEHHLVDSQGLLNSPPPQSDLPARPATVMPSTQDMSLLSDLTLSESGDSMEEEASSEADTFEDVPEDEDFVDADDDSRVASSPDLDSITAQEALPLAAAVKKSLPQRKIIGRRNPGRLSSAQAVPSRRPTAPLPVSSRRKSSTVSASSSKNTPSENAPT